MNDISVPVTEDQSRSTMTASHHVTHRVQLCPLKKKSSHFYSTKESNAQLIRFICCWRWENDCSVQMCSCVTTVSVWHNGAFQACAISQARRVVQPASLQPVIIRCYWRKMLFYIQMLLCPSVFRDPSIQMRFEFKCLRVSGLKTQGKTVSAEWDDFAM